MTSEERARKINQISLILAAVSLSMAIYASQIQHRREPIVLSGDRVRRIKTR